MFNTALHENLLELTSYETSLYAFLKASWHAIEGNNPFIPGWHIEAICEHLEATIRGDIKKLIINIPPRMTKTNIISIAFPAWVWGPRKLTHAKFLFGSHAQKISWDHSRLCKLLIESPWYQERWGDIVKLSKDQSTKGHFANTALGHRIAISANSGATALGADVLVGDDFNDAGESEVTRKSTNDWLSRVWFTRLNPGGLNINIIVQQRTNEEDVSGSQMSNDEYTKLVLPMEFETSRRARTIILPSTKGKIWEDPRTIEGELLCADYIDAQAIARRKIELGSYNYAGQYQQRPSPEAGGIIQRAWFKIWEEKELPNIHYIIQSWDTALTDKKEGSYSACTTWGLFKDKHNITQVILLTSWRDRIGYHDILKRAKRLHGNYLDIYSDELEPDYKREPDKILVEAKATGFLLVSDLVSKGIPATGFTPDKYGDKTARVHLVTPYIESGRIWVATDVGSKSLLPDHEELVHMCTLFPKSESRDLVDTMTMAILYLSKEVKLLSHVMSPRFERDNSDDDKLHRKEFAGNNRIKIVG